MRRRSRCLALAPLLLAACSAEAPAPVAPAPSTSPSASAAAIPLVPGACAALDDADGGAPRPVYDMDRFKRPVDPNDRCAVADDNVKRAADAILAAPRGRPDEEPVAAWDAFVEPAPAVYEALVAYAERGAAAVASIDPRDEARAKGYFDKLAETLRVLAAISRDELSGEPLSDDEERFLAMVVEMHHGGSAGPPTYSGWYFDLFPSTYDALARADFVADYFTSGYEHTISYAGATAPRLGVFVVDAGGAPRVVVGPVARGYEVHGPLDKRLDDEAAAKLAKVEDPWAASYTVAAPREPEATINVWPDDKLGVPVAEIEAPRALGAVTVELCDHHRRPIQSLTRAVGKGKTRIVFKRMKDERTMEAVHVAARGAHAWVEMSYGGVIELGKKE